MEMGGKGKEDCLLSQSRGLCVSGSRLRPGNLDSVFLQVDCDRKFDLIWRWVWDGRDVPCSSIRLFTFLMLCFIVGYALDPTCSGSDYFIE